MNLVELLVFVTFIGLIALTIADEFSQTQLKAKSREDWLLDGIGLSVQGILVPLLQTTLIYQIYHFLLPLPPGCLNLSPLLSFLLSFVAVDYLYYWNHRLLHSATFWQVHQVHHTVTDLDVLGTSRNTLWTSLLIVYLWVHALFLYLLFNPTWYLLGVSLTSALDLWRHSRFTMPNWYRYLFPWLILPQDHAWHHSSDSHHCNYGANLNLWDRVHGTYNRGDVLPVIGIATPLTLTQKLLFPFS